MADGGTSQKTVQVSQRIVADGGSPHIDAPAVRGQLNERGLPAGAINRGMDFLDGIDARHLDSLSSAEQATLATRLARSSDPDGTVTFLNRLEETSDVQRVLDEDLATTDRMVRLHENRDRTDGGIGHLRYRNVDPELEASDFVHVARHGDLTETRLIVKRDGAPRWLEEGNLEEGWTHIEARHIEGEYQMDVKDGTSMFPTGETVKGNTLPNTLAGGELTARQKLENILYDAVKYGEATPDGQKTKYYFEPRQNGYPDSGIDNMRVHVYSHGAIETSYPLSGEAVQRWVPDLNDGQGGWVDTV